MEATTLKKKSTGLSKGKLKKTIKNVLCRPDSIHWPVISEENERDLSKSLTKYKVEIPEFKKLLWKDLKNIPKAERPKPPAVQKPTGLIFGLRHCFEAIRNKDCSALILDSEVNPKTIVQPIIELCFTVNVPVICLKNLKELTISNFGFKTISLSIKQDCLEEISEKVAELSKKFVPQQMKSTNCDKAKIETVLNDVVMSERANKIEITDYLLKRTSKKSRVFVPPTHTGSKEVEKKFIGQDFIEFSEKFSNKNDNTNDKNAEHIFKNMKLKRIANNPNRVHMGKKRKIKNAK